MTHAISRRHFLKLIGAASLATLTSSPILAAAAKPKKMSNTLFPYVLPPLPYTYDALSPVIDETTMMIHHTKHHAGYTKKLNTALESWPKTQSLDIETLLSQTASLPTPLQEAVRNNGGGFYNHALFWTLMTPNGEKAPIGSLKTEIEGTFGSFSAFQEVFSKAAATQFGSGWAWLIKTKSGLKVISTPNQDNPLMTGIVEETGTPILCLDVWEHAYYLSYQNKRKAYIENWWNIINWKEANQRFETGKA